MYSRALTALVLCTALAVETVTAISKISAVGSKFFKDDGSQFYIKGDSHPTFYGIAIDLLQALHINLHPMILSSTQINAKWTLL